MTLRAVLEVLFICLCPHLDAEITASVLQSVCSKRNERCGEQTDPYAYESLSRMSKLIDQRRVASSQTHLVLQAYCLADVDEINPLGIEIWYRTTRSFSVLGGIEAIRSVPKKYRTRYPTRL